MRIGLISDTHGYFDPEISQFFDDCDEIWHAGDIGSENVLDEMEKLMPVRAVWGNIDDAAMRLRTKEFLTFECEGKKILMIHIGGYPGHYSSQVKPLLLTYCPDIFIAGHSHILKVINDPKHTLLHINPGAAGNKGWHKFVTAIRFQILNGEIGNLDVFEKKRM